MHDCQVTNDHIFLLISSHSYNKRVTVSIFMRKFRSSTNYRVLTEKNDKIFFFLTHIVDVENWHVMWLQEYSWYTTRCVNLIKYSLIYCVPFIDQQYCSFSSFYMVEICATYNLPEWKIKHLIDLCNHESNKIYRI